MTDRGNASRVKSGAKRIWRWLFIIYAIALTTATHWPRLDLGVNDHPAPDKFLHLFAFAGLTFLFWRTRWLGDRWLLLFVMFIWAAIDEWTQGLPGLGRNPNHADMLANWTGILLAFAWIRAMRPLGGPLNRLRHARSEMIFDSLPHRPRTWLLGFGFAIPSALLVGAGAGALTYYVDPEPIMHGALLGAILGGGLGAGAAIARAWPAHEQMLHEAQPCFSCREPVENITFNDHGLSVCSSCGVAVHEAQWRISLALPRQPLLRAGLSAGPIAVGFVLALIVLYVAVFLGTLQSQTFRTAVINWLPMELRIAIDLAMIGIVLAAAFRVFRHRIAARFDAQGRTCRHCNHDLNATPVERGVGRCGECGTEFIRLPDPPPTLDRFALIAFYPKRTFERSRLSEVDTFWRMAERFEKHARTVTLLTMASRVTGLARDAVLSRVFGVGVLMDAFFFAFLIPNLFRRLFGEGALSAAFLPIYARLHQSNPEQAKKVASLTMAALIIVLGLAVILGEGVLYLISLRADHENPAIWLMMIMLPYMPMVCAVAILGAMLQVHGKFGPTAAAPMVLNVLIVIAALGLTWIVDPADEQQRLAHIGVVASSVILAGVIQVAWSLIALRGTGWWTRDTAAAWPEMKRIAMLAGPMILGLGVLQLNTLFDGLIASYPTVIGPTIFGIAYPLDEGAMATVSFAQRLYQFPLGVFGIAIATAIFPLLARQSEDASQFANTLRRGLRLVVFIGLPASAGLMLVREPLAAVILQGGDFTAEDSRRVGTVLLGYGSAVWAYSMMHVLTRAFYARGDSMTPVKVACSVVALNLALNLILIWPLAEAGLAWSTAICSVVQVVALLVLIRRKIDRIIDRDVLRSWLRTAIVTGVMAALVWGTGRYLMYEVMPWVESLIALAAMVCVGGLVVLIASPLLRMRELPWALGSTK